MNNIQNCILDMFKEFKVICKKNNLRYFAIGGTCLGAVRHKGFIPWDDDMDVAMPYEDYRRFIGLAKQQLKNPYFLQNPSENKDLLCSFIRIHNIKTSFIVNSYIHYPNKYMGVWLDIMPIFGLPKSKKEQIKYTKRLNLLLHKNAAFRFSFNEINSFGSKIFWLTTLWQKITKKPFYYFTDKIESSFSKVSFDNSDKILFGWRIKPIIPWHHTNYKQVLEYKDFSSAIEVQFEDTTIAIPVGYDNYLKMDFGDYMKLPPENKRVSGHGKGAIIDLERPYSYYQDKFKRGELK